MNIKFITLIIVLHFAVSLIGQKEAEILPEGIVFPRLTNTEKSSIVKKTGQFIYNADDQVLEYVDSGNNWRQIDPYRLKDRDGDTYITPEFVFSENILRMHVAGSDAIWIRKNPNGQMIFDHSYQAGNLALGGAGSGYNLDPNFANDNLLVGPGAGSALLDGDSNVILGSNALQNNQGGSHNVAIGKESMNAGTTGHRNIAIGARSLKDNGSDDNIAIGYEAMFSADESANNIAIGNNSLRSFKGVSTNESIAIGTDALRNLTSGASNIAIGYKVGEQLTSSFGSPNTIIGYKALSQSLDARANIVIGTQAMEKSPTDPVTGQSAINNTVVGDFAMRNSRAKNCVALGSNAMALNVWGTGNVAVGVESLLDNETGSRNTSIGFGAMHASEGSNNVAVGEGAAAFYEGNNSVFIGFRAGAAVTTGDHQLHIGHNSLISGDFLKEEVNINSILNLVPRGTIPASPKTGTMYMDNGTNIVGGVPTLRIYINPTLGWKNI